MLDFLHQIDIVELTRTAGYIGLTLIIFCETGLFLGFFLPGDSLLFAAGLLASQNIFNLSWLMGLLIVAAILGYIVAYWLGRHFGNWLLKRPDSLLFKKRYLTEASAFYAKHGGKALIIGRLLPIIRTFLPIVAGMANMSYRRYSFFNIVGALVWCGGVTLLGYYLGATIPNAEAYILPLVLGVIVLSLLPGAWHLARQYYQSKLQK